MKLALTIPKMVIDSKEKLEETVNKFQLLPFFPNDIKGLSIEEMCAPGMLFGGNYEEGAWEWKGPVIRKRESAYGKFFRRKAGFVSLDLLPDFLNYRRHAYPVKPGSIEELLLDIIRENDSLTSTSLKQLIFGNKKRTKWDELPEQQKEPEIKISRKSLESPLQRLQMGGWLIISDFEYKKTRNGDRYGWGVACYSTPEVVFGELIFLRNDKSPEDSLKFLIDTMKKKWMLSSRKSLEKLLK